MENILSKEFTVASYHTDVNFNLKPSAYMDFAQDMAYHAAGKFNFGYEDLQQQGDAWVLSRMHIKFASTPKWRSKVKMSTWHKGLSGLYFLRDFILTDQHGEAMILATSSWVVIDRDTRRLVRSDELQQLFDESAVCRDNAIVTPAPKILLPKSIEPKKIATHTVSYSDLDFIGHTNNTRYILWALDAIDYDVVSQKTLKELTVNFLHETMQGQEVELYLYDLSKADDRHFIIEGRVAVKSAFVVDLLF